jgi:hypothetical protein
MHGGRAILNRTLEERIGLHREVSGTISVITTEPVIEVVETDDACDEECE